MHPDGQPDLLRREHRLGVERLQHCLERWGILPAAHGQHNALTGAVSSRKRDDDPAAGLHAFQTGRELVGERPVKREGRRGDRDLRNRYLCQTIPLPQKNRRVSPA